MKNFSSLGTADRQNAQDIDEQNTLKVTEEQTKH